MQVELIYDGDCPNVQLARLQLKRALVEIGRPPRWREWDRADPGSPRYARDYGSPTILVDGEDVAAASPSGGADCCRVYSDGEGALQGVPPVEMIAAALRKSESPLELGDSSRRLRGSGGWLAVLPAVGVAMIPKLACPACWPAYAGLLSSLGLPFVPTAKYLFPLTAAFLVLAVGALGFRARRRRGYAPLAVGAMAAILVMVGKFVFDSDPAMFGGIALLIVASFWNSWPKKTAGGGSCPCAPTAAPHTTKEHGS